MVLNSLFKKLKDGRELEFRTPAPAEAQAVLDAMVEIAETSPYILSTAESFRKKSVEAQTKWIENSVTSETDINIAVYFDNKIIGFCNGVAFTDLKRRHRAGLGVSIHADFRGVGLGRMLMELLIEQMKKFPHIQIIELDVMSVNEPAIQMYKNLGFTQAGVNPRAYILTSGEECANIRMYLEV